MTWTFKRGRRGISLHQRVCAHRVVAESVARSRAWQALPASEKEATQRKTRIETRNY